jgi:hypothetical protein
MEEAKERREEGGKERERKKRRGALGKERSKKKREMKESHKLPVSRMRVTRIA